MLALYTQTAAGSETDDIKKKIEKCNTGDAYSCMKLASTYKYNPRHKNLKKYTEFFKKMYELDNNACEKGDGERCLGLAEIYDFAEIVELDIKKATSFYDKAIQAFTKPCDEESVPLACYRLGSLYSKASKPDREKGRKYREKACDVGYGPACEYLGRLNKRNPEIAVTYYKKGCDFKSIENCLLLGYAYKEGKGVPQSDKKASEAFKIACAWYPDVCDK